VVLGLNLSEGQLIVIILTLVWELGEYVGDRLLDTTLKPSKRGSAEDIFFGTAGGVVGITFAGVVAFSRPPHPGQRR
jgi:hypothetical protein